MNEWTNERTNERTNEWMNERTNERMNEWTNERMNAWHKLNARKNVRRKSFKNSVALEREKIKWISTEIVQNKNDNDKTKT